MKVEMRMVSACEGVIKKARNLNNHKGIKSVFITRHLLLEDKEKEVDLWKQMIKAND